MRRTSILCLLLLCAVLTAAAGPLSNRRAPGFSLPDSQMRQHDLQDYRGKVVLLNFMQTACPHCNAFSKVLAEAERRFAGKVQVLDVVTTPPDTQATVATMVDLHRKLAAGVDPAAAVHDWNGGLPGSGYVVFGA